MNLYKQIRALRATVASVIAQLDALEEAIGRGECVHPEEDRKSIATFDDPDVFQCGRCGEIVESRPAAPASSAVKEG